MTLYEAAGGAAGVLALAADFHARCLTDPVLEHPFSHAENPDHVQRLADYWGEVWGGPPAFSEQFGGHVAMLRLHANQGAETDLADRFVAAFEAAIDGARLPDDPRMRSALGAYIRWATDEVMEYSPAGAVVPAEAAMPRWDFDGLVPA
jgi:hemoglobin